MASLKKLAVAERQPKIERNNENQEKFVLMEDIGNLRQQILEEFWNITSSFFTEFKSFKNEFLQSCVKHSPSEQVNENSITEILERFIHQLKEQI